MTASALDSPVASYREPHSLIDTSSDEDSWTKHWDPNISEETEEGGELTIKLAALPFATPPRKERKPKKKKSETG